MDGRRRGASVELDGVRWWLAPGVAPEAVRGLLARAHRTAESGGAAALKQGRRKQLYSLAGHPADTSYLLKVNRYDRGVAARRRLRRSKARHELSIATALADRGVATPVPIAAGEQRSGGLLTACLLLVPIVEGAVDALELWRAPHTSPAHKRQLARSLGAAARALHEVGLAQPDFAPNNFLVCSGPSLQVVPVDFERARVRARIGVPARRAALAKLERHFFDTSASSRLRFLIAYAGSPAEARQWWRALDAEGAQLARRDFARLVRRAASDSRRFQRIRVGNWQGWARRDAAQLPSDETALAPPRREADAQVGPAWFEARGSRWVCGYSGCSARRARETWASAQSLWIRGGLTPKPAALLHRGGEMRLLLERAPAAACPADATVAGHRAAVVVLFARLLRLGGLRAPAAGGVAVCANAGGTARATLLDVAAFQPREPPAAPARRLRIARAFAGAAGA